MGEPKGIVLSDQKNTWGDRTYVRALDTTNANIALKNKNLEDLERRVRESGSTTSKISHRIKMKKEIAQLKQLRERRLSYEKIDVSKRYRFVLILSLSLFLCLFLSLSNTHTHTQDTPRVYDMLVQSSTSIYSTRKQSHICICREPNIELGVSET
jgi:hypothetical protein